MTYKEFLEMLEELELDIDSAAEALDLEISDIESWEEEEEIPPPPPEHSKVKPARMGEILVDIDPSSDEEVYRPRNWNKRFHQRSMAAAGMNVATYRSVAPVQSNAPVQYEKILWRDL